MEGKATLLIHFPLICFRFNGITNKSLETASRTKDDFFIIENNNREDISENEYVENNSSLSDIYITNNYSRAPV